ncbi:MAG TPA: PD-(D/E)XK nuclease family protein [Lacunisphaera sp.]|jgi:hypothetical protein
MSAQFGRADRFICDLQKVCAASQAFTGSEKFLSNLDRVHQVELGMGGMIPQIAPSTLGELDKVFKQAKIEAISQIGGSDYLEKLPANHPLRCSVSLFGSLDFGLRETAHTRTLAWLMDPFANHGFGVSLLWVFLKLVFSLDDDFQIEKAEVRSEVSGDESRDRVDIHLSGMWTRSGGKVESWLVLVEAKIEADESLDQCGKYESQFRQGIKSADMARLIFLTTDGRRPTSASRHKWDSLSFIRLVSVFWKESHALMGMQGLEFLRLYVTGVLTDVYNIQCGKLSSKDHVYLIGDFLSPGSFGGKRDE